jgi:hypothetical protein
VSLQKIKGSEVQLDSAFVLRQTKAHVSRVLGQMGTWLQGVPTYQVWLLIPKTNWKN